MGKYQPKVRTLPAEPSLRVPALAPGQPSRDDGERVVAQWRDVDLTKVQRSELVHIIAVLGGLRRHDVGLWEEQLLGRARAEQQRRKGVP